MLQLGLFDDAHAWKPKPLPPVPEGVEVAVDTETRDPDLKTEGSGWRTGKSAVVGVSVDFDMPSGKRYTAYWPFAHKFDNTHRKEEVMDWMAAAFKRNRIIMANAPYDIGNLSLYGVPPPEDVVDIQIAESLIEEEGPNGLSLEVLGMKYCGRGKNEGGLRRFAESQGLDPKADIWKMPGPRVGPYAEEDAALTRDVWQHQKVELTRQNLWDITALEMEIVPIIHRAVKRGICFDVKYAEELDAKWSKVEKDLLRRLGAKSRDDLGEKDFLLRLLKQDGVEPGRTKTGLPSVTKALLERARTPMCALLRETQALVKCKRDYLEAMMERVHRGRVHPEFIQSARADGDDKEGTRTGRFASKNPNIQQIPKRSAFDLWKSKDLRKCYVIGDDGTGWAKYDYNAQEPRMQVHYGLKLGLKGAKEVMEGFAAGRKVYKTIEELVGDGVTYDQTKTVFLGKAYGMGNAKLALDMGLTEERAAQISERFDAAVPYIGETARKADEAAQKNGYVVCMMGRRRHFNWWEPARKGRDENIPPVYGFERAREIWPNARLRRAHTRKAYNALIQGGCSVQTKLAIRDSYKEGLLFNMTVHDEISWPVNSEREAARCGEIMATCLPMLLPSVPELDLGKSWC